MLGRGELQGETEITAEARFMCWEAWGILPDTQVALENFFNDLHLEYSTDTVGGVDEVPSLHM